MPLRTYRTTATLLLLAGALLAAAQQNGMWRADNQTARSITGDIAISGQKLSVGLTSFPMVLARALTPAELSAAFAAPTTAPAVGNLYKLNIPAGKTFMRHNTLCGTEDTEWLATYAVKNELQLSFFSGQRPPVLTIEALADSTNACGTYTYFR